jgi:serine/threonine protein kinase
MCPEDWCEGSTAFDVTRALAPGSMLSHYRIEAEAGHGAFASVFRAHDTVLDRIVALKVFRPGRLPTASAALSEARSVAALNHPNVCTVFAVDDSEGDPIIVMEYLPGRTLSRILEAGAMPAGAATVVGRQIALGVGAAHRLGITHGDLKPANVMLTGEGVVKITDFGLARRRPRPGESEETEVWGAPGAGNIAGTPSYMSPEQCRGDPATPASDVFSFALVLYEMLTGRKAFTGENVLHVLNEIQKVDAERYAAEVPEPFARILRQSLAREASDRLMTMEMIAELLTQYEG